MRISIQLFQHMYTVGQKTATLYFYSNFVKTFYSETIIGRYK